MQVALERGDRTARAVPSIHDAGIELDLSQDVRITAEANRVVVGIGLDCADGDLDGGDGDPPLRSRSIACGKPTPAFPASQ